MNQSTHPPFSLIPTLIQFPTPTVSQPRRTKHTTQPTTTVRPAYADTACTVLTGLSCYLPSQGRGYLDFNMIQYYPLQLVHVLHHNTIFYL
jgi:hypothetical protein